MISKKAYNELVCIVDTFDREAAEYMRTDATLLKGFGFSNRLISSFIYSRTPQGSDYWFDISRKINQFIDSGDILPDELFVM